MPPFVQGGCKRYKISMMMHKDTHFAIAILFSSPVCSVIYHCDIGLFVPSQISATDVLSASMDDIMDTACEICELLKYEFICIPVSISVMVKISRLDRF